MLKGVVFDLDGTVVDSRLDFAAIRRDLGLKSGVGILEAIEACADSAERTRMHGILDRHEMTGADGATLMPGIGDLLADFRRRSLRTAVFTRNSRRAALHTIARLQLSFDIVIAREDAPPKPDPSGLAAICSRWRESAETILYIGDYVFDLEAGRRAGMPTVLYAPTEPDFEHDAEWVLTHFDDFWPLCGAIFSAG
ncbi:MAG: HAD family hydrolase [Bdellovibrionaceae bacterium]|nr:HAD family hydrolase [Pseudobdellovibrionaceae bacterium]